MKVGDKVKGFKFEKTERLGFTKAMNNYIDVEGTVIRIDLEDNTFKIKFDSGFSYWYPLSDFNKTDSIVESVINQFKQRSESGINKYGTTLDRNDLSTLEWIEHAKQEAMDFILYLEKLKQELK